MELKEAGPSALSAALIPSSCPCTLITLSNRVYTVDCFSSLTQEGVEGRQGQQDGGGD